jgi:hypothetical protein
LLCGSILFDRKIEMQNAGVAFLNAWGSVKFAAQIYNAARKENFLEKKWEDMEFAIQVYGERNIFAGSAPSSAEDYFKCFALAVGYSAQNFARSGRRPHTQALTSNRGPRGLMEAESITPITHVLKHGCENLHDPSRKMAPVVQLVLQRSIEPRDPDGQPDAARSRTPAQRKKPYTVPEALEVIREALHKEELALTLDHFRLHRSAWRALRSINAANDANFRRMYDPLYLQSENQLPFVAGYIFMSLTESQSAPGLLQGRRVLVVDSRPLKQAAEALDRIIEAGLGGLEAKILRDTVGSYQIGPGTVTGTI